MRKRISYRVAGLLLGTGLVAFAGGPGVDTGASSLVHAGIVTAWLRER